jgi:hypothetical protein
MSQALNNALGEAAHRKHILALLGEWETAVYEAGSRDLAWLQRLVETGDKLAAALSLAVLGEDIGKGEST